MVLKQFRPLKKSTMILRSRLKDKFKDTYLTTVRASYSTLTIREAIVFASKEEGIFVVSWLRYVIDLLFPLILWLF